MPPAYPVPPARDRHRLLVTAAGTARRSVVDPVDEAVPQGAGGVEPVTSSAKRLPRECVLTDDAVVTMTARLPHPSSVAALLRTAEAHEAAAAVLRTRNPGACEAHAGLAVALRARASSTSGGA